MNSFIVTYFKNGTLQSKEFQSSWWNILNDCQALAIYQYEILKIELRVVPQ